MSQESSSPKRASYVASIGEDGVPTATKNDAIGEALWDFSKKRTVTKYDHFGEPVGEGVVPVDKPVDSGTGTLIKDSDVFRLKPVTHRGDGTVPRASWAADIGKMQNYCLVGNSPKDPDGFEHQQACNDWRAREAALLFMAKIIHKHKDEVKK